MNREQYDFIVSQYEAGLIEEVWRDILGYEGFYMVSNYTRIKSLSIKLWNGVGYFYTKEKIKTPHTPKNKYEVYRLYKDGKCRHELTHRLVALAFVPNPENKTQVNHNRGIKEHNYPECLSWTTPSENMIHAHQTGLKKGTWLGKNGKNHCRSKSVLQYDLSGNLISTFESAGIASTITGISKSSICYCARGIKRYAGGFAWEYSRTA